MIRLLGTRGAVCHLNVSVPNIRKKFSFDAISAFLGLPSAGMLILGIQECLLCREVLNVELHHSSIHINTTQSFGGLVCIHVALISVPLVVHIPCIIYVEGVFLLVNSVHPSFGETEKGRMTISATSSYSQRAAPDALIIHLFPVIPKP